MLALQTNVSAQNIGIGTLAPLARLHVADSAVVFTGPVSLPVPAGLPPVTGGGTRMMWYPNKAAFRAGNVSGTQWNENNVGSYSSAFGRSTRASGQYATAFGLSTTASGIGAFAAGDGSNASGVNAVAFGEDTKATKNNSLVIGQYNEEQGTTPNWENEYAFIVGGGYVEDIGGIATITRKNVFTVSKVGTTVIGGATIIKNAFTAQDISLLKDTVFIDKPVGIGLIGSPKTSLDVNGGLTLRKGFASVTFTGAPVPVTVGDNSFIEIAADNNTAVVRLSNGAVTGQLLILVCGTGSFKLVRGSTTAGSSNVQLPADRILNVNDTIMLMYYNGDWYEVSYTNISFVL